MTDTLTAAPEPANPPPQSHSARRPYLTGLFAAGLIAVGLVAGAGATILSVPRERVVLMQPTAITKLASDSDVAVKGKVVEIYGNKFVVDDGSGRALVETGRAGEGGQLVAAGETLTVQGHFDNGFIHGELLMHADGKAESLRPPRPGPRGLLDRLRRPDVAPVPPGGAG
ncbi:MAG: hypothetical protein J0I79_15375 [Mesorhizobium sp.]|uniref:hypothetical protein n=1 Tax=Mesorhizobium sp. TaxID=1871066 RepID=UPI001AC873F3|nr:hypothetical protein [Mesorhizobium sp.]MBN9219329.1 hypothetical protein [Mesorhizobium sp.]